MTDQPLPPVRSTHRWPARHGAVAYDTWGCHGRPVLLIASVLFDRSIWWPAAAELRPHATVIAVDLPGHGESADRAGYEPQQIVDDLADLIAGLNIRRAPVIVGHGGSAGLATMFSDRYATHAVVTVDPLPTGMLATPAGPQQMNTYLDFMGADTVPEDYRSLAEPVGDSDLLAAYHRCTTLQHGTCGAVTAALTVHSTAVAAVEEQPADAWQQRGYDVPGRFAHLARVRDFAADIRALL